MAISVVNIFKVIQIKQDKNISPTIILGKQAKNLSLK